VQDVDFISAVDSLALIWSGTVNFKSRFQTRVDEYRAAFYLTPRIYLEGVYATDNWKKGKGGNLDIEWDSPTPTDYILSDTSISGGRVTRWEANLGFNLYTHKPTGISVDVFAGYTDYKTKVTADLLNSFYNFAGVLHTIDATPAEIQSRYAGPNLGLKLKAPFTLPDLPKNPFTLNLSFGYIPNITFRNRVFLNRLISVDGAPVVDYLMDAPADSKIRGSTSYGRIGLSYQFSPNISIEAGYNYFSFKQRKDTETTFTNLGAGPTSTPYTAEIKKNKIDMHGPSISVKCRF